jgi:HSP20 family molecular chaperone IbpA
MEKHEASEMLQAFADDPQVRDLLSVRGRIEALLAHHAAPLGPRADLLDAGDAYQLIVDVPGVDQSQLEVGLHGDDVVISGLWPSGDDPVDAILRERPQGPFERRIRTPEPVQAEGIAAYVRAGVLVVTLPKRR